MLTPASQPGWINPTIFFHFFFKPSLTPVWLVNHQGWILNQIIPITLSVFSALWPQNVLVIVPYKEFITTKNHIRQIYVSGNFSVKVFLYMETFHTELKMGLVDWTGLWLVFVYYNGLWWVMVGFDGLWRAVVGIYWYWQIMLGVGGFWLVWMLFSKIILIKVR